MKEPRKRLLSLVLSRVKTLLGARLSEKRVGKGTVALLLGGEHGGKRLSGWDVGATAESALQELASVDSSDEEETEQRDSIRMSTIEKSVCLGVAQFLAEVLKVRAPLMRALREQRDSAASSEGRSPEG